MCRIITRPKKGNRNKSISFKEIPTKGGEEEEGMTLEQKLLIAYLKRLDELKRIDMNSKNLLLEIVREVGKDLQGAVADIQ